MGQIVELGYGKANLSNTVATYAVMRVKAPFNRDSGITSGPSRGSKQVHPVGRHDMTGHLVNTRVEHENGTILLIQSRWMRNGAPIREGALFMRLRAGAPLYRIEAKVPLGPENIHGDKFVIFSGHADALDENELTVAGLKVNRSYTDKFMSREELDECYYISEVAPETQARPSLTAIATPEGLEMREIAPPPMRRMRLRRQG